MNRPRRNQFKYISINTARHFTQHEKDTVDDVGDAINLLRSRAECFAELFAQVEKGVVVRGQVQAFGARLGVQALAQRQLTVRHPNEGGSQTLGLHFQRLTDELVHLQNPEKKAKKTLRSHNIFAGIADILISVYRLLSPLIS